MLKMMFLMIFAHFRPFSIIFHNFKRSFLTKYMELECFGHSFGFLVLFPDDLDPQTDMTVIFFWPLYFWPLHFLNLKIWPLHFIKFSNFLKKNKILCLYLLTSKYGILFPCSYWVSSFWSFSWLVPVLFNPPVL